jgi:protease-4
VADARHRRFDQIEPLAQGRVWMGDQAKANGLVDYVGGLDTALDVAKRKANIPASERVTLATYPGRRNFLDILLRKSQMDGDLETAMLETKLAQVFGRMPFRAWLKGGYLRIMPYWVDVR